MISRRWSEFQENSGKELCRGADNIWDLAKLRWFGMEDTGKHHGGMFSEAR
jgi:hypothetical protein